jgi:DNA helicase-2/ATP-dependent DNA helicase PcrA
VVRGRIDAVYRTASGYQVLDWKTDASETADPLQLAIYRLAWAELSGVDPGSVSAAFHYVRSGRTVQPELPGRAEIEALLDGGPPTLVRLSSVR